jgi:signal transduction histidine kinase
MSLSQKIWLLMTVPFVVAILAYVAATRPFRRELLFREANRELRDDATTIQAALASGVVDHNDDLAAFVESVSHSELVLGVALYSSDGTFLASSKSFPDRAQADELARQALQSKADVSKVVEEASGMDVLQHAIALSAAGPATNGVVVVFRDISYVDRALWDWNVKLATVGLISAIAMLLASRILVRRLVESPLKEVMSGVSRVAEGQLESDVPSARNDELGTLARAFNDMTSRLRVARSAVEQEHAQRAALEARMRHLQTLAVAGEVAASLAHEIGSPLNVILGRTRLMAARPETSDAARAELETIGAQTERISRTVQKLLRLSRPARQILEDIDIRAVAEDTISFIAPECRNRRISTSIACTTPSPPKVRADRDQITQILFNLCHNAMQAQPKGGRIDIKIGRTDLEGRTGAVIEVTDAGPGIAPAVKGRIFDPFVTTKENEGGNGLGLAIVDGMVRELGGVVEADDGPEGGACFRIRLPALASEKAA